MHKYNLDCNYDIEVSVICLYGVSLFCSFAVGLCHIVFPDLRARSARLIFYMTINNFLHNCVMLISLLAPVNNYTAFFSVLFFMTSAIWSTTISRTLRTVYIYRDNLSNLVENLNSHQKDQHKNSLALRRINRFRVFVVTFSFTAVLLGICLNTGGLYNTVWFWWRCHSLSYSDKDFAVFVGCIIIPLLGVVLYNLITVAQVFLKMRSEIHALGPTRSSEVAFPRMESFTSVASTNDALYTNILDLVDFIVYFPFVVSIAVSAVIVLSFAITYSINQSNWMYTVLTTIQASEGTCILVLYFRSAAVRARLSAIAFRRKGIEATNGNSVEIERGNNRNPIITMGQPPKAF